MNTAAIGRVLLARREHIIALEPSRAGAMRHAAAEPSASSDPARMPRTALRHERLN
jgi:hypothetical protein